MKKASLLLISIAFLFSCKKEATSWKINSPNNNKSATIELVNNKLTYSIKNSSDTVIAKSTLGIERNDESFVQNLSFVSSTENTVNEKVNFLTGKKLEIETSYNIKTLSFKNENGALLNIEIRAYNDAIAFRYIFPDEKSDTVTVLNDLTTFNLSKANKAWLQQYDSATMWTPAYENFFENEIKPGIIPAQKSGWSFPALFSIDSNFVLITESGIDGDYAATHIENKEGSSIYSIRWPEKGDAMGLGKQKPSNILPWKTPWKVIVLGKLNEIVETNIVKLLAPENRVKNTEWIKPGRASWSWLSNHNSPKNFDKLKEFIDLAVEMEWEYSLVDANWDDMKGGNIQQLVEYANSKNVGILMWYNSGGPNNIVTEKPRDIMNNKEKRRAEFKKLQEWGVKGVKIDFFQSDKQFIMKLYKEILEDAAEYEILVNFHGCTLPKGWSRTYPNLMTMEAVRGAECYTFDKNYPQRAPELNTILPFTRNAIGSMDYTPVIFTNMENHHITTYGHELALSIVFESGILHMADAVKGYTTLPDKVKSVLKTVPTTWDETKYISGYPGKDVVIARRKDNKWYIGGINGEGIPKTINIDLSVFYDKNKTIIYDGNDNEKLKVEEVSQNNMMVNLLPYGGFLIY